MIHIMLLYKKQQIIPIHQIYYTLSASYGQSIGLGVLLPEGCLPPSWGIKVTLFGKGRWLCIFMVVNSCSQLRNGTTGHEMQGITFNKKFLYIEL